jgi:hypothetical protein
MDRTGAAWRKSSFSGGNGGACVEVAIVPGGTDGAVALRDSKNPSGPVLLFSPDEWREFTSAVRQGEFA